MPDSKFNTFPEGCAGGVLRSFSLAENRDWRVSDFFPENINCKFTLAAPSWVVPATARENCEYLSDKVDEVCLLLFETESCLKYGEDDLPSLSDGKELRFHTHLPLDLDWNRPAPEILACIEKIVNKVAFLDPWAHVLHPPLGLPLCRQIFPELAGLMKKAGLKPSSFLIENIKGNDLCEIIDVIDACGFGICFDLGHVLAYSQECLLRVKSLWSRVRLVHLNAPGKGSKHEPLNRLDKKGVAMLDYVLKELHPGTVITLEVFEELGFVESLSFLAERESLTGGI